MVADVAHWLHTPLPALLEMDWEEVEAWHSQAARLSKGPEQ